MTARAFSPGHVTGFFSIPLDRDQPMDKMGSRGAGFSVQLGATAEVDVDGKGWDISLNGEETSFLVVEKTLLNLAPGGKAEITTDLPFSQGFGMSGAVALSTGIAALADMGEERDKALQAAHRSEVFCRTGLGDVIGQWDGGFEIRTKGGLPPDGEIKREKIERNVVIAVAGSALTTADVLKDPMLAAWIKAHGDEIMEEYMPDNGFDRFLEMSRKFAEETEFMRETMKPIVEKGDEYGAGSMSMIGNSAFFFGDTEKLGSMLVDEVGEENVFVTGIDNEGARVLD